MTALPPTALPPTPAPAPTDYRVREALAAHARGWVLMPLRGKIPILDAWQKQLRPPEVDVERWARQGNVGLRTGTVSQVVVLDVDTVKGGVVPEDLPSTPTVITGSGGYHYYFRAPAHQMRNSAGRIAPHVDFRAEGGQVVFPGSIHPDTGKPYLWAVSPDDCELADLPEWIVEKLVEPKGYAAAALRNELARVTNAREGERNDTLYRAAFSLGTLVGGGQLDEASVSQALTNATSLPIAEAAATIRSGLTAGKLKPRQPPTKPSAVLVPGAHIDDKGVYVEVGNHQFADSVIDAMPAGTLYRRGNVPGDVVGAQGGRWFRMMREDHLRLITDRHVRLGRWVQKKEETHLVFQTCNADWGGLILSNAETHPAVRDITTMAAYPVYTPNKRLAAPGWNEGGVFYDEPPELTGLVPNADCARDILEDLVVDFPFRTQADRENYFGLLLTPILRPMIAGNVPMHLIGSSLQGTGKTKLVSEVMGRIFCGRSTAARQFASDEGEMKKELLSILIGGDNIIHIDNLMGHVNSPILALIVTAEHFGGRVLGRSFDAVVRNQTTLVLTGNNVAFSTDNARRVIPVILQPKTAEPERRNDFVYEDLIGHVEKQRRAVLEVLIGMVEGWIAAGCPRGKTPMGSFEDWAATVGGVLQFYGFDQWGTNLREFRQVADPDREDWNMFERRWWEAHRDRPLTPTELVRLANECAVFQYVLSKGGSERGMVTSFAQRVLAKMVNAPVGESVVRQSTDRNGRLYRLERGGLLTN